MNQEIGPHSEKPEEGEGFEYHIVDNTKRPLFTEEDLLRGDLEGNYVLVTGQNPPFVAVKVEQPTELESMVGRIALARLRERVGLEIELSPEEEAILNDPNSMSGANIDYIRKRTMLLLEGSDNQIDSRSAQEGLGLVGRIMKRLKSGEA